MAGEYKLLRELSTLGCHSTWRRSWSTRTARQMLRQWVLIP